MFIDAGKIALLSGVKLDNTPLGLIWREYLKPSLQSLPLLGGLFSDENLSKLQSFSDHYLKPAWQLITYPLRYIPWLGDRLRGEEGAQRSETNWDQLEQVGRKAAEDASEIANDFTDQVKGKPLNGRAPLAPEKRPDANNRFDRFKKRQEAERAAEEGNGQEQGRLSVPLPGGLALPPQELSGAQFAKLNLPRIPKAQG